MSTCFPSSDFSLYGSAHTNGVTALSATMYPVPFFKPSITLTHGQTGCPKLTHAFHTCAQTAPFGKTEYANSCSPVTAQHAKKHKHLFIIVPLMSFQPFKADNCLAKVSYHKHKLNIWIFLREKSFCKYFRKQRMHPGAVKNPHIYLRLVTTI